MDLGFALYIKFFVSLFALINPVGILPIFLTLTASLPREKAARINLTASCAVAIILWVALFLGGSILDAFGVSVESFRVAGGVLLCMIAMTMVNGKLGKHKVNREEADNVARPDQNNVGIVPLALPMLAGPGAITSTIVWGTRYHEPIMLMGFSIAITGLAFSCWLLFRAAPLILRLLGQTGINALTRIMGILLMALGIELVATGVRVLFPVLG